MRSFFKDVAAVVAALFLAHSPASATPTPAQPTTLQEERVVWIPFDPPIGQPLRYRIERVDDRNGTTRQSSDTVTFEFEEAQDGFRLIVTPISGIGPELEGPISEEFQALRSRPYTLILDASGQILGMEQEEEYWNTMIGYVEGLLTQRQTADTAPALQRFIQILRDMSPEVRLALLTDHVQPLISYADIDLTVGERLAAPVELPSLFGGTVETQVYATLERVDDGLAHISSHATFSREGLERATQNLFDSLQPNDERRSAILEQVRNAEQISREFREAYQVSMVSGLTERYRSTDETDIRAEGERTRRVRITSLEWID